MRAACAQRLCTSARPRSFRFRSSRGLWPPLRPQRSHFLPDRCDGRFRFRLNGGGFRSRNRFRFRRAGRFRFRSGRLPLPHRSERQTPLCGPLPLPLGPAAASAPLGTSSSAVCGAASAQGRLPLPHCSDGQAVTATRRGARTPPVRSPRAIAARSVRSARLRRMRMIAADTPHSAAICSTST
jgi:hypothetical protein